MATIDLVILLSITQDDLPPIKVQVNKTKGDQGLLVLSEEGRALLYQLAAELTSATVQQIPSVQEIMAKEAEEDG